MAEENNKTKKKSEDFETKRRKIDRFFGIIQPIVKPFFNLIVCASEDGSNRSGAKRIIYRDFTEKRNDQTVRISVQCYVVFGDKFAVAASEIRRGCPEIGIAFVSEGKLFAGAA